MSESLSDKQPRVGPPQVKITYDVETRGVIEKRELPFVVGIFADLSGDLPDSDKPGFGERTMVAIDRDNFGAVLKSSKPRIDLSNIDNVLPRAPAGKKLSGFLRFDKLEDFEPLAIVKKVDVLKSLYEDRCRIRTLQAKAECDDALDAALDDLLKGRGASPAGVAPELLAAFHAQVKQRLKEGEFEDIGADDKDSARALIDHAVDRIDKVLGKQLSMIMHARNFQALEATWRGMHYLVDRSDTGRMLKLRVLNATRRELFEDLRDAGEFDQSAVFKIIYEAEYGTFGGSPYGLLLCAYEFGPDAESVECLTRVAEVAAAAHAPFIAAANADMFGLPGFDKLDKPRNLAKIFDGIDFIGWNEFRDREDSRYVGLVLPRVLLRLPYGDDGLSAEGFNFQEDVVSGAAGSEATGESPLPFHDHFLWGNAAFFLGERITNAFTIHHWTAATWGAQNGGQLEDLPLYIYDAGVGGQTLLCPTETGLSDHRVKELSDLGFISLSHCKDSGRAVFLGSQSACRPHKSFDAEANAITRASAKLPCLLAASRFAHYIKTIMREKLGSFLTRGNVEDYLNAWIAQYVLEDDDASQEVKAAHPLRAARIRVTDVPGEPGAYKVQACLQPHYQLEGLDFPICLTVGVPG